MKRFFLHLFFLVLFCSIDTLCFAQNVKSETDSKEDKTPCCEVTCRRSSCKTYAKPCSCTCFGGQAYCGGLSTGGGSDDKFVVTSSPVQIVRYDTLASYIARQMSNIKVANAVVKMKKLFEKNGYVLDKQETVSEYLYYMKVFSDFYSKLSYEQQAIIDEL